MPHTKWNDNGIMYQHLQHILCPAWKENIKRFLKKAAKIFWLCSTPSTEDEWKVWKGGKEFPSRRASTGIALLAPPSPGDQTFFQLRPPSLTIDGTVLQSTHIQYSLIHSDTFSTTSTVLLKDIYKVFSTCVDKIDLDLNFCGPKVENVSFNIVDDRLQQTNWSSSHQTHRQSFYVQCTLQSIFLLHSLSPYCLYIS